MNRKTFKRIGPNPGALALSRLVIALLGFSGGQALGGDTNLPVVSISAVVPAIDEEGGASGEFRIERSGGDLTNDLRVYYRIAGSAGNGVDYQGLNGTVTLGAGDRTAAIRLIPIDDAEIEPSETVEVRLCPRNAPFALAILPDTQYYVVRGGAGTPEMFFEQTRWIATHRDAENIAFVLHEGDVTDLNTEGEWLRGRAAMRVLDGVVPYAISPGNHDGLAQRVNLTERFNRHFALTDYERLPTFGGVFEAGKLDNGYHFFSAGGVDWMVLVLEFGPRDVVLTWANEVVAAHPERRVIVLTHAHLYPDDTLQGAPEHQGNPTANGRQNNGTHVWEKLLRRHANIAFVFNGHSVILPNAGVPGQEDQVGRLVGVGDAGNRIFQIAADYQSRPLGGGGFMRIVRFFPDRDAFSVQTYSPYLEQHLTDEPNQFEYDRLGIFTPGNGQYQVDAANAVARMTLLSHDEPSTSLAAKKVFAYGKPPEIEVTFNRPVEAASAQNPAHYALDGGLAVTQATLSAEARVVTLAVVGPIKVNVSYTLSIDGVQDLAAVPEVLSDSRRSFGYTPVLLAQDFSVGALTGWTVVDDGVPSAPSSWSVWEGALFQFANTYSPVGGSLSGRKGTYVYWDKPSSLNWSGYVVSATLNAVDDDGIGLLVRYQNRSNYYKVELDRQQGFRKLLKVVNGTETLLASEDAGYSRGTNLTLRVEASRDQILVSLDGQPLFGGAVADNGLSRGTVALYAWASAGVMFDDVYVTPLPPLTTFDAPSVRLVSPSDGEYLVAAAGLTLCAEIEGNPDNVREVKFYRNADLLGTVVGAPFTLVWTNLPAGEHALTAQARDNTGVVGLSPPVRVHVTPTPVAPFITVQPRARLTMPHTEIQLSVQAGGTWPLRYQWFRGDNPMLGATNTLLVLRDLQAGDEDAYWAEVRNGTGLAASDRVTVRLVPPGGLGVILDLLPPDGQIEVSVLGNSGGRVRLEKSANLREWSLVANTNDFAGTWRMRVGPDEASQTQFFRAARF
jgi:hypothetical protein